MIIKIFLKIAFTCTALAVESLLFFFGLGQLCAFVNLVLEPTS